MRSIVWLFIGVGCVPVETGLVDLDVQPPTCASDDMPGFVGDHDPSCVNVVETPPMAPAVEWGMASFEAAPTFENVMMTPIVVSLTDDDGDGDIDGDDVPDIVFSAYAGVAWTSPGVVRAVSGDGASVLWTVEASGVQGSGNLAGGDLDGDGVVEIVAVTTDLHVVAFDHTGVERWRSDALSALWSSWYCRYAASPAIADLDGDGSPEVIVGHTVLSSTGEILWTGAGGHAECASFGADVDLDGQQEVVTGNTLYRADGTIVWQSATPDGYPAVADFDGDAAAEIVVVDTEGTVRVLDTDGTELWSEAATFTSGPPTVADYDGDGRPEIGVAGTNRYVVYDTDGTELWRRATIDASSGRTGSSVYDFEGDGIAEVVYADEENLWVLSGVDGSVRMEAPHTNWTWLEYAVIADVDGDDEVEIVVPNGSLGGNRAGAEFGLTVYGDPNHAWQRGRKIWNQHAYSITNVDDDGRIPAQPDASWRVYNSFRSGDLTGSTDGALAPDLAIDADTACVVCEAGELVVRVHVANLGAATAAPGSIVEVWGTIEGQDTLIEAFEVKDRLIPGQRTSAFDGRVPDAAAYDAIRVTVRAFQPDCDVTNDAIRIEGPFCSGE